MSTSIGYFDDETVNMVIYNVCMEGHAMSVFSHVMGFVFIIILLTTGYLLYKKTINDYFLKATIYLLIVALVLRIILCFQYSCASVRDTKNDFRQ